MSRVLLTLLCSALLCSAQNCVTSFCKCQELISVILVLLLPGFNFSGQTNVEVRANLLKVVQYIHNTVLDIEGWNRNPNISYRFS
mgnify:CR=1 FL=1